MESSHIHCCGHNHGGPRFLIFLVEKLKPVKSGHYGNVVALCDRLLPNSRPGSSHESESPTTLRVPSEVRKREPRAPATLGAQR